MAYGARLESVLGATPQGFESLILRHPLSCLSSLVPAGRYFSGTAGVLVAAGVGLGPLAFALALARSLAASALSARSA